MGRAQRAKGARGELEAADKIRTILGIECQRSARNGVDGATDLDTAIPWNWEVKRYARLGVERIMQKAEMDSALGPNAGNGVVTLMRADDCEWILCIRLADFPQFARDVYGAQYR